MRLNEKLFQSLNLRIKNKNQKVAAVVPNNEEAESTKIYMPSGPSEQDHWVIEVLSGNDQGRHYLGIAPETKIGRHPENHIQLSDPKVSRFHAVLHRRGPQIFIEDLHSTNGTQVNNEKLAKKMPLVSGDQITLGDTVLLISHEKKVIKQNS